MTPNTNRIELAEQIASQLNETDKSAIKNIEKLIDVMGEDFARTVLEKTLEIEGRGGMFLEGDSETTKRTPGGVFFYLAKQELSEEQRKLVFPSQPRKKKPQPPIEIGAQAQLFAHQAIAKLKEDDPELKETIGKIAQLCGVELAQSALDIVTDIENQDGLRRPDGSRRSPGEAFLYIASRRMTNEQRQRIWPQLPSELRPPKVKQQTKIGPPTQPRRSPNPPGVATTSKMIVIGRPESVEKKSGYMVFILKSVRVPNLPKGLPVPPENPAYRIYVQDRQWERVARVVDNPDDSLIIEGYPTIDQDQKIAVFAVSVKSKSTRRGTSFSYR